MGNLLPNRHPNRDFFILDVSDTAPKDDLASMEHPVFSLSVKPDMRELAYEHNGRRLLIVPSGKGLATIMDKDILLYCISKLVHMKNAGEEITEWVELSAHEVMVATNWRTNRESYQRFEDALDRLRGTTIKTDVPTGGHMQLKGFGLIDEYEINRKMDGAPSPFGRMTRVRIKVSDWTFRAIQGLEVLTINPQYFRLRRPLERRIYELARKHVGDQGHPFTIGLSTLQKKVGSNSPEKKFRYFVKQIAADGHIPDYDIAVIGAKVIFTQRCKRTTWKPQQAELDLGDPLRVSPDVYEKARSLAPGYDVQALYHEWRAFAQKQVEAPRSANGAFLGFCKRRHRESPLT
ncbi:MAG: replication initiator protein A [Geminicoccaceae bacterium]